MMKKILTFLFLFFSLTSSYASNIDKIIFFGDSLTDNGNLYTAALGILPKSPPYFHGRFSNGPVWAERVDQYYLSKFSIGTSIYAWGGATAIFHLPTTTFGAPTLLELEMDKYLVDSVFRSKDKVLFIFWIGANDYLFYPNEEPHAMTQKVTDKIAWAITTLKSYGARHFLILNLPDLSKTPYAKTVPTSDKLHTLSAMHNIKLDQTIKQLQGLYPDLDVSLMNIYDIFNDVIEHPEKYNEKYHVNIVNTAEACWRGGFFGEKLTQKTASEEIEKSLTQKHTRTDNVDVTAMSHFIVNTPSLNYVYAMGQSYLLGNAPCANANEYLFWDNMHPTAVVHDVLAQMTIEILENKIG